MSSSPDLNQSCSDNILNFSNRIRRLQMQEIGKDSEKSCKQ